MVLSYSGFLEYFPQGGTGVPCSPFCALVARPFDFVVYKVLVLAVVICDWVVMGLGWCKGGGEVLGVGFLRFGVPWT